MKCDRENYIYTKDQKILFDCICELVNLDLTIADAISKLDDCSREQIHQVFREIEGVNLNISTTINEVYYYFADNKRELIKKIEEVEE